MTDERKQEFTLRITQANATALTVILYEMFLEYTKDASSYILADDREGMKSAVQSARSCLEELIGSLDLEYEIAGNLLSLYLYVNRMLIQAQIKKSVVCIEQAEAVIRPLFEAYRTISVQDTSPSLMQNTQTIVAGMTYGRDSLHESLEDQGALRGYFV